MTTNLKPNVKWTNDCQGKKDYDGPLVSVSSRYWPSHPEQLEGKHWNELTAENELAIRPYEKDGRPSAIASIVLDLEGEGGNYLTWREQEFKADTQEDVKRLVEEWVQEQFDEVRRLLGL